MSKKRNPKTNYYWPMFIYIGDHKEGDEKGSVYQSFTQRAFMTLKEAKEWIEEKTLIETEFGGKIITSWVDVYGYNKDGFYKKRRRICVKTDYVHEMWF